MSGARQVESRPSELPSKDYCILLLKTKPMKVVKTKAKCHSVYILYYMCTAATILC